MAAKILIAVISLVGTAAFAKNVTLGDPSKGKLVYEQTYEMEPSPNSTATGVKTIHIPEGTIKAIEIQDLQGNGRSSVLTGGIGQSDVKIALFGDRGVGFRFRVKVYTEPKPEESTKTPEETTKSTGETEETDGTTPTEETTQTEETEATEEPEETTPTNYRTRTRKPEKNKKPKKPQHRKRPPPETREPDQRNQKNPDGDDDDDDEPDDDNYYDTPCDCACESWYPCWSYSNCC